MNTNTVETYMNDDESIRARVIHDPWPSKPDGDGYGTVLFQEGGYYRSNVETWAERWKSEDDWESVYAQLWDDLRDIAQVEAVLRGKANICEECGEYLTYELEQAATLCPNRDEGNDEGWHVERYDFSDNPVVGFDVEEMRDGRLVIIVSLADLKVWGYESLADWDERFPGVDPAYNGLHDFSAYITGETYYVEVEQKVKVTQQIRVLNRDEVLREFITEEWDVLDYSCGGFYGTESAAEYAKEALSLAVKAAERNAA